MKSATLKTGKFAKISVIIFAILLILFSATSCDSVTDVISNPPRTLDAPANVRIEGNQLCWNPVENASRYLVSINGNEYYADINSYSLGGIGDGDYVFKVKAVGDSILYNSSAFSLECSTTFYNGETAVGGYYSQFDDLTKNESFLGYGFDVIRSSVFSDKYVKTSFPIFKTDELMNQRLLKVDSKYVHIDEISSSSMDEFMSDWNVNANVNVSWGKKMVGGSVDVEAAYSGGTESTRSKYFHAMTFTNQEFYIVMQSDMATLRSIISDSLRADLYSDVDPAVLFDRYGTHFITSAVMGGKINSYYLYTSEEEKDFHDVSAKVSVEVRYWAGQTNVDVSGGYRSYAESQNIDIKNTFEVIGGADFGMLSDEDISAHYADWEKSLENHASLMGIKDTGSLQPLWELIDPELDTLIYSWDYDGDGVYESGNRSQQLQAYFMAYGTDAYNDLMESAALPEIVVPEKITDVRVNNELANANNEFTVYAGVENDITFTVEPAEATGYAKSISLATPNEYVTINDKNQLVIDSSIPYDQTLITVVISAGNARKQINVRVIKTYTVDFVTNVSGISVDSLYNVIHGSQIDEPELDSRPGYNLAGWYTSSDFAEGTKYEFGLTPITSHVTLYAKWEKKYPVVHIISSLDGSITDVTVNYNSTIADLDLPTATGYTFGGWYEDAALVDEYEDDTAITKNTTIYVKWIPINYTVSFNTLGGSTVESQSVSYNSFATMPEKPTKAGYTFAGWYKDARGEDSFDFYHDYITSNTTIYAAWVEFYPTVTVKSNIASDGKLQWSEQIAYGNNISAITMPSIIGYTLEGFYTTDAYLNAYDGSAAITDDVTVYAKYTLNTYSVAFDVDGGSEIATQSVTHGARASSPADPIKEGYTFLGWYTDTDFETIFDFSRTKITANTTVYALWEKFYPTVTLASPTESYIGQTIALNYGAIFEEPADPTLRGHSFGGWYADAKLLIPFDFSVAIKSNTTIYAKWTVNNYTVTFDSEGGSSVASQTVPFGGKVTRPTTPTKHGNNFVGWFTVSGTRFDFSSMVIEENITLYAEWTEEAQIIIAFDSLGGSTHDYQNVFVNSSIGDNLPTPTKAGYSFVAWYKTSELLDADRVYSNTTFSENTTLFAKWTPNTYTVTLEANGGTVTQESFTVIFGDKYGDQLVAPEKVGYTFTGWYDKSSGGNLITSDSVVSISDSHTLYARYSANEYTVAFDAQGGSVTPASKTVIYGTLYGTLPSPSKTGSRFEGWYTAAVGGDKISESDLFEIAENQTLYAHWTNLAYTLTLEPNGGEVAPEILTVIFGSEYGTLPTPTRYGYTFAGWYTALNGGTKVEATTEVTYNGNHTVYAHWNNASVTVTFSDIDETKTVYYDMAYGALSSPTKTGYTFIGWYTAASGGVQITAETVVATAENHTLYPRYTANTYTIIYNGNGHTGGSTSSSIHTYGIAKQLNSNGFYKTGYNFIGWNTKSDGSGTSYVNNSSVINLVDENGGTITLYAQWTISKYSVSYNTNGGTNIANSIYSYQDTTIAPSSPTRTGYNFAGWEFYDAKTGTKVDFSFGSKMPAYDILAKAIWNYKSVSYDSGYEKKKIDASYEYTYDTFNISALSVFMVNGYKLKFAVSVYMAEEDEGYQEIYVANSYKTKLAGIWPETFAHGGGGKDGEGWENFTFTVDAEKCTGTMHLIYGASGSGADDWYRYRAKVTVTVIKE